MSKVAAVILSGGEGVRLRPLTEHRCKPALPLMGRYTLIDVAISNALLAGIEQLFIITQYLSHSLYQCVSRHYPQEIHHIKFIKGEKERSFFLGTAEAVRKSRIYLEELEVEYLLILSSDQIYSLNFLDVIQFAEEREADLVICTIPVSEQDAKRMGVMQLSPEWIITHFTEKPNHPDLLNAFRQPDAEKPFHANMGIYLFKKQFLFDLLEEDLRIDFGMHILPSAIQSRTVWAYPFNGFWKDVGTPLDYFEYHLSIAAGTGYRPKLLSQTKAHIAPTMLGKVTLNKALICDGCWIEDSSINLSLIGPHCRIGKGCQLDEVFLMGGSERARGTRIGTYSSLRHVLVDQDTTIGNHVRLENLDQIQHLNHDLFEVRNGIIILPQQANIPDHFVF
ncbi:sugar phosphate nucleotidyltransferase [Candidatus Similichlamydia laticola]|uniref:Glucose-1-phosphate adenylyltransferase n=1 Tax=Candidatus Similichlamydia laticola TaxID=2170265 RepID=A0A369KHM1_9BACT|nr:sugar phosphate nucleotidyltransferase [Candidatus Similichlamydia laticola]RDB31264.1 Glucose-1-phosphate adenylyltransferase [Candidatus Similichlamydia laticola]